MAANMIGVSKRIIAVRDGVVQFVMYNPVIIRKTGAFETEEGCLSLSGMRKAVRFRTITVSYQDTQFQKHSQTFTGFTAQIIQHEIDHCDGIVI